MTDEFMEKQLIVPPEYETEMREKFNIKESDEFTYTNEVARFYSNVYYNENYIKDIKVNESGLVIYTTDEPGSVVSLYYPDSPFTSMLYIRTDEEGDLSIDNGTSIITPLDNIFARNFTKLLMTLTRVRNQDFPEFMNFMNATLGKGRHDPNYEYLENLKYFMLRLNGKFLIEYIPEVLQRNIRGKVVKG